MDSGTETSQFAGFGSGIFGVWIEDEDGLPAYRYTLPQDDPRAVWHPLPDCPSTLHWHQLGNDRITANAYNLGMVQVFYGESGPLWLNHYDPVKDAHCGGFGWLAADGAVLIDRDDGIPPGAEWERVFGIGYVRKRLVSADIVYERRVFAPAGDLPVLVSTVRIENRRPVPREITLVEYWDVHYRYITKTLLGRIRSRRIGRPRVRLELDRDNTMLAAVPALRFGSQGGFPLRPRLIDPEPPAVFVACLDGNPATWITRPRLLFDAGRPRASVSGIHGIEDLAGRVVPAACLAPVMRFTLAPGETRSLHFLYGYAKGRAPHAVVDAVRREEAHQWERTAAFWKDTAPALRGLDQDRFLEREIVWDYYAMTSSLGFDAYYQHHAVPQGGNYLYHTGLGGAARDMAAYVQTLTYYRPAVAREMLVFLMRAQEANGRLFYDLMGYGRRNRLPYRPSDLGLWFLGALCEYIYATRDFAFLDETVPYYPLHARRQDTVWGHACKALDHLIYTVGTGPHGHIRIKLSDWNDEMTWLTARDRPLDIILTILRGESVLNTAMACHILPLVRALAGRRGDHAAAAAADGFHARMVHALNEAWNGRHLVRSYSGLGKVFGDTEIWLEPQVWALLAEGTLAPEREALLVREIVARLKQPSELGLLISSSSEASLTTRPGEQESGGVWFAVNGPAAVALARFDPELAWDELIRNTLAWHAHRYPLLWYGIWSGPDAWNGPVSRRPGQTWRQHTLLMDIGPQLYPVQNTHAHSQTLFVLARLAGITPTPEGWTIAPRVPYASYTFACDLFSLEVTPAYIAGTVHPPVTASLGLEVRIPKNWQNPAVTVQGHPVASTITEDKVVFAVPAVTSERIGWKIEPMDRQS